MVFPKFSILLHPFIQAIDPTPSHNVTEVDLETHSHGIFPIQRWQERFSASIMECEERGKN